MILRRIGFAVALAVAVAAAFVVPLPFLELSPGPVIGADRIVTTARTDSALDDYLVTAVSVEEPSLVETVIAAFDDDDELIDRSSLVPSGVDEDEFLRVQERLFRESARLAVAVGLRAAGRDVRIEGDGALILAVADDVDAADHLEVGDVVVEVADTPVSVAADIGAALSGAQVGDDVAVVVRRDGGTVSERVEVAAIGPLDEPGLGVLVQTDNRVIDLPPDVEVARDLGIGGPSGGLMIALATYDSAVETSLADGRLVAGSGTIDASGTVGSIGGVHQKVVAAIDAGAEVFVVAPADAAEARDAAGGRLTVVEAPTLGDAIDRLGRAG